MKKWIQELKKGALHKQLEFPEDQKIPIGLLHKIEMGNIGDEIEYEVNGRKIRKKITAKLKKRVVAALTLRKLRKK